MPFTRPSLNKVCSFFFLSRYCLSHFGHFSSIVTKLNDVRDDNTTYNNRVDTTLADVFSLLSLCYLTLGRTKECPAVYSQLASMRVSISSLYHFIAEGMRLHDVVQPAIVRPICYCLHWHILMCPSVV